MPLQRFYMYIYICLVAADSPQTSSESRFPVCKLSLATLATVGSRDIKTCGRQEKHNAETKGPHWSKSFVLEGT